MLFNRPIVRRQNIRQFWRRKLAEGWPRLEVDIRRLAYGVASAEANGGETGKAMKAIIRDCLAGTGGRPKLAGWVPAWLRFPAGSYTAGEDHEAEQPLAEAAE